MGLRITIVVIFDSSLSFQIFFSITFVGWQHDPRSCLCESPCFWPFGHATTSHIQCDMDIYLDPWTEHVKSNVTGTISELCYGHVLSCDIRPLVGVSQAW